MGAMSMIQPILSLVYLVLVATGAFVAGAIYMNVPIDPVLTLTSAALVFGIYALNKFTDKEDFINDPEKKLFFESNFYLYYMAIVALAGSVFLLLVTDKFSLFHFFLVFIGVAYSISIIPRFAKNGSLSFVRIKDLWYTKSTIPSILWGTAFFAISWSVYPAAVSNPACVVILIISCTLANFMNTNFADIRDYPGDAASGVGTMPVVLGIRNTYLYTMLFPGVLWLGAIVVLSALHIIAIPMVVFLIVNLLFPLVYIGAYHFRMVTYKACEPLADSYILIFALGLIVLRYI